FQWRPGGGDVVVGQLLYSESRTPARSDLASEWTGQSLSGHAAHVQGFHNTTHLDWVGQDRDIGDGFRADTGFIPPGGLRELTGSSGWTFRPNGFLRRLRTFVNVDRQVDTGGALIDRTIVPGFGMDSKLNGFMQYRFVDERVRAKSVELPR